MLDASATRVQFIIGRDGALSLAGSNYTESIIVNLASLPDFLRRPMLKRRMAEFFEMAGPERDEIINNALEAGPEIPFPNFARLFRTWLEVLCALSEGQREQLLSRYVCEVARSPDKLVRFHLDGMMAVYDELQPEERETIASTTADAVAALDIGGKRRLLAVIPDGVRVRLGI